MAGFGNKKGTGGSGDMEKAVYDTDNDGVVDDSQRLGGELPGYYATDTELANEAAARQQDDATLAQGINAEATARQQADATLAQGINAEATARQQADATLAQADATLAQADAAETAARQTADTALASRAAALEADTHRQNTDTGTDKEAFDIGAPAKTGDPDVPGTVRTIAAKGSEPNIELVLQPKGAGKTRAATRFQATEVHTTGNFVQDALPRPTNSSLRPNAPVTPVGRNPRNGIYIDLYTGFDMSNTYYLHPDNGNDLLGVVGDPNRPFRTINRLRELIPTKPAPTNVFGSSLNYGLYYTAYIVFQRGTHYIDYSNTGGNTKGGVWEVPHGKLRFVCEEGATLDLNAPLCMWVAGRNDTSGGAGTSFSRVPSSGIPVAERWNGMLGRGVLNLLRGSNSLFATSTRIFSSNDPVASEFPLYVEAFSVSVIGENSSGVLPANPYSLQCPVFRNITSQTIEITTNQAFQINQVVVTDHIACHNLTIFTRIAARVLIAGSVHVAGALTINLAHQSGATGTPENSFQHIVNFSGGGWINRLTVRNTPANETPVAAGFVMAASFTGGINIATIENLRPLTATLGTMYFEFRRACNIGEVILGPYLNTAPTAFLGFAANVSIQKSHEQLDYVQVQSYTVSGDTQMRRVRADVLKSYRLISYDGTLIGAVPTHIDCPYIKSISIETIRLYQLIFQNTLRTLNPIVIQPDTHGGPNACDIIFTGNVEIYVPDTATNFAIDIKATGGFADTISNGTYSRRKINIKNHGNILTNANREDAFGGAAGNIINTGYHQETKGWFIQNGVPVLETTTPLPNYGISLPTRGLYVQQALSLFFVV